MSYYFNPHGHQCPWYPYSELLGYPSASRCEEVACYIMSEPTNTTSALAFFLVAVLTSTFRLKKDHPDIKLFSNIFMLSGVFIAAFHVMNNFATQILAHGSIFFLILITVIKNFMRMGKLNYAGRSSALFSLSFIFLLLSFALYQKHAFPEIILPISFFILIGTEIFAKKYNQNNETSGTLFLSFALFMFASIAIYLDQLKFNCQPQSYFQLHSIGHILLAISMGFLFKHLYQFYPIKQAKKDVDFKTYPKEKVVTTTIDNEEEYEEFVDQDDDEYFEEIYEDEDEVDEEEDEVDDVQIEFDFDNLGDQTEEEVQDSEDDVGVAEDEEDLAEYSDQFSTENAEDAEDVEDPEKGSKS